MAASRTNRPPPIALSISSPPPQPFAAEKSTDIRPSQRRKHRAPMPPAIRVRRQPFGSTYGKYVTPARSHAAELSAIPSITNRCIRSLAHSYPQRSASNINQRLPQLAAMLDRPIERKVVRHAPIRDHPVQNIFRRDASPLYCNRESESLELSASDKSFLNNPSQLTRQRHPEDIRTIAGPGCASVLTAKRAVTVL